MMNKLLSQLFKKQTPTISHWVINPPSWLERQVQNQKIEDAYRDSLKSNAKDHHWSDKYSKHFKT